MCQNTYIGTYIPHSVNTTMYKHFYSQVLVELAKSCDRPHERHLVHHVPSIPSLLVHLHLRAARHASLRRLLQLSGRQADVQLRHDHERLAHSFPGSCLDTSGHYFIYFVLSKRMQCFYNKLMRKYPSSIWRDSNSQRRFEYGSLSPLTNIKVAY